MAEDARDVSSGPGETPRCDAKAGTPGPAIKSFLYSPWKDAGEAKSSPERRSRENPFDRLAIEPLGAERDAIGRVVGAAAAGDER